MRKLFERSLLLLVAICFCFIQPAFAASASDEAVLGNDRWSVTNNGDLIPGTTNTYDIGNTTHYPATICLGGECKASWGSVVSPITDASGYVYPTDATNNMLLYDTGNITIGGGAEVDVTLLWNGSADDFYIGLDDSADDFVIGYGAAMGTDNRITIVDSATVTTVVVGDATENDMQIYFDGNAQDFHIGLDDTADDLVIGLGSALGTTTAIGIDENLAIATYGNITMGGTTPTLTIGDAGAEDTMLLFDGNAQDFYISLDDSADDLLIGVGLTPGTTPAISITDGLVVTTYANMTMTGTTPTLLIGDAGAEDAGIMFDGNEYDFHIVLDDSRNTLSIGNTTTVGASTAAITIDSAQDVTLDTGNLYIKDDKNVYFGNTPDVYMQYDEAVDDQFIFVTATTGATATTDPLFEFLVPATPTADQQVFGVAKGTQASNTALLTLDEDGDAVVTGTLTSTGIFTASSTSIMTGSVAITDDVTINGTTPTLSIGDGGNEDNTIVWDGQTTKDFYIATDNADDSLIIGVGSTVGTDSRITIQDNAAETRIELGDAVTAEDTVLVFDGNAQDFYIALDDSADDLLIGLGATVATTPAISIDENLVVTTYGDIIMTGTTPLLTIGDGGDEDAGIQWNSDTTDYYIASENALDDLQIGVGSAIGTTPAIGVDSVGNVQIYQNATIQNFNYCVDAGSTDAYNCTVQGYVPAAIPDGFVLILNPNSNNTGACSVDIDGAGALAAVNIKSLHDADPADSYMEGNSTVMLVYDGTNFEIINPDANP